MAWELDPDSFQHAVEDLWLGLNVNVRKGISGYSIDRKDAPRDPRSAPLVALQPDDDGETATLVVKYLVIEGRLQADHDLSWRPELARAMRRAAFTWTRTKSAPPSPSGRDEAEESPTSGEEPAQEEILEREAVEHEAFASRPSSVQWNPPAKKVVPGIHLDEIRTLWFGLDERIRGAFGTIRIDEGEGPATSDGEALVSVDHGASRSKTTLVVYLGTLKVLLAEDPGLAWRPHLARAIKRAMMDHSRVVAERNASVNPPAGAHGSPEKTVSVEQVDGPLREPPAEALNYGNTAQTDGRWSTPPRSSRPEPMKAADVPRTSRTKPPPASPPTWATTTATGRSSVAPSAQAVKGEPSEKKTLPTWLRWTMDLFLGPARAAFRPRDVESGVDLAKLWAWRVGIVSCYGASIFGLLFLTWSVAGGWKQAAFLAGEAVTTESVESGVDEAITAGGRQPLHMVELEGREWLLPAGWQIVGEGDEQTVVLQGPARARIEIVRTESNQDRGEVALARACAAGRRARVAFGGNGLSYVDTRFEDEGEVWQSRCIFVEGVLIRGLAPLAVFLGENLGDWILLASLDQQWAGDGEARSQR